MLATNVTFAANHIAAEHGIDLVSGNVPDWLWRYQRHQERVYAARQNALGAMNDRDLRLGAHEAREAERDRVWARGCLFLALADANPGIDPKTLLAFVDKLY